MEIANQFELPLPPDDAYRMLLDLERVAPCMPGASLGAERGDARELSVTVRLGPMKFVYGGTVEVTERDDAARRAVLVGSAEERRGQGSANATITMTVAKADAGSGSRVESLAVFDLTGRAAQTGRGIVEDVARRMVGEMAACLAEKAGAAEPPAEPAADTHAPAPTVATHEAKPIRAGRLFFSMLWERIARLWRRRR